MLLETTDKARRKSVTGVFRRALQGASEPCPATAADDLLDAAVLTWPGQAGLPS
jgi:hypothetical protein